MSNFITKIKKLPRGSAVLMIIMMVTVLSFFVQSALPPEASSAESNAVSDAIEPIIPSDTPVGEFVHPNIRKIGHFSEFGLLGLEAAIFVFLYAKKRATASAFAFVFAQLVALLDETVQIFSGRGPEITDVWIDILGFSTLFAVTIGAAFAIRAIMNRLRKNG